MSNLRKVFGLVACVLIFAGCSSGPGKSGWFSWMPTIKLPTIKSGYPKDKMEQQAVALSDETEPPKRSTVGPAPIAPRNPPALAEQALATDAVPAPVAQAPAAKRAPAISAWPARHPKPQPESQPAYDRELTKAIELDRAGQTAQAREVYQRLVADDPGRPEAYHRLGLLAAGEDRHTEAEGLYGQALKIAPRSAEVLNDLGFSLYCAGKLAQAEGVTLKAVAIQPSDPQLRKNLGMIYGHQGRGREALEQFRLAESEADACADLAEILSARNDRAGAKDYLKQALSAEPTHARARQAMAALGEPSESPLRTAKSPASPSAPVTR